MPFDLLVILSYEGRVIYPIDPYPKAIRIYLLSLTVLLHYFGDLSLLLVLLLFVLYFQQVFFLNINLYILPFNNDYRSGWIKTK